jgi:hypothetical protein
MIVTLVALVVLTVAALSMTIFGEWMIGRIPAVRQVREAHRAWGCLRMKDASICSAQVSEVVQLRFEELSDGSNDAALVEQVRNKRFGDVITIVWYKERGLRTLTNEIRTYCAIFLVLLLAGVLLSLNEAQPPRDFSEAVAGVVSYHVVPFLEALMLVYLSIRLLSEAQSLKSILEE